ncbi:TetR/AcrR family transcriptional regulator [Streptomyces sp. NPDC102441]|uniref:TetR/AcrR family transcriptional regulator n=1 Tax=Streptomyces sp. NPDC102441 TaxID=3366176 RepID=UPI0038100F38
MDETPAPGNRRSGRPLDEGLRGRVLETAIDLYAEQGWSGFNFEAVARRAGVGRPALYRRWGDREALLKDTILGTSPEVLDADLGSLHDELLRLLSDYLQVLRGSRGRAGLRLYLDAPAIPGVVAAVHAQLMGRRYLAVSAALSRATERAGRPSALPGRLVFNLLLGGAVVGEIGEIGVAGEAAREPTDAEGLVAAVVALTGLAGHPAP